MTDTGSQSGVTGKRKPWNKSISVRKQKEIDAKVASIREKGSALNDLKPLLGEYDDDDNFREGFIKEVIDAVTEVVDAAITIERGAKKGVLCYQVLGQEIFNKKQFFNHTVQQGGETIHVGVVSSKCSHTFRFLS